MKRVLTALSGCLCVTALAYAEPLKKPPTAREIAAKSRSVRLERTSALTVERDQNELKFTPADLSNLASLSEFESGRVVGRLRVGVRGECICNHGIPPGTYNLFVARVGKEWRAYAQSEERVVDARRATVEEGGKRGERPSASLDEEGYTLRLTLSHICIAEVVTLNWYRKK